MNKLALAGVLASSLALSTLGLAKMKMKGEKMMNKTVTLKGEVLDMACYMGMGASGAEHASCARTCLKDGSPVGLKTSDGKVYFLVPDHRGKKFDNDPYMQVRKDGADIVTVTGTVLDRGGAKALTVDKVSLDKDVK